MKYIIYDTITGDIIHSIKVKNSIFDETKYCFGNQSFIEVEDDIKTSGMIVDIINKTLIALAKSQTPQKVVDIASHRSKVEKFKRFEENPLKEIDFDDVDTWVDTNVKSLDDVKQTLKHLLKLVCKPIQPVNEQDMRYLNLNIDSQL